MLDQPVESTSSQSSSQGFILLNSTMCEGWWELVIKWWNPGFGSGVIKLRQNKKQSTVNTKDAHYRVSD